MSLTREILTRAIVGKGKKRFKIEERLISETEAHSILGCWVINHKFEAKLSGLNVDVDGEFDINIWYSSEENSKTEVVRKKVKYNKKMTTKQVVENYSENNTDVLVRVIQQPTCTDAKIVDSYIEVDIIFELLAEVIGETKMQVTVFNQTAETHDEFEDLDDLVEPVIE